jgi:carbamoyltransferase
LIWHQLLGNERAPMAPDAQHGSLLGPWYSGREIAALLDGFGARYRRYDTDRALSDAVAGMIAGGRAVAVFQGRAEFGPRALGARSIVGDPRDSRMQSTLNLKIKFRESFRPFAPSVLAERAADYFDQPRNHESPYMLLVAPVNERRRVAGGDNGRTGLDRVNTVRSTIPAVTHVDHSARVQTVDPHRSPRFHALLTAFERLTGCPVLVNTSFNVRGEPIVNTPEEAYRCFMATGLDALVLEDCVLLKEEQPAETAPGARSYTAHVAED